LVSAAEAGEKVGSLKASTAGVPADAVLRLGRGLAEQLISVRERSGLPIRIHDMYQKDEDEVLETVCRLCRESDRPLIVTAKNNERLCEELIAARQRGKRVVTLVSDLDPSARDVFIGIDNRMAGQTAALLIGRLIGGRPCKVGVIVGDYAFRCHEDREIGFRAYLPTAFPEVVLADVARGEDSPQQTRRATLDLFAVHPEIAAVYNVAGGNLGLASALEELGHANEHLDGGELVEDAADGFNARSMAATSSLPWTEMALDRVSVVFSRHITKDGGRHAAKGPTYQRGVETSGVYFGPFASLPAGGAVIRFP
jgi:hypothetical protein